MEIEVVEFYPFIMKKNHLQGTLHIYIPELDMDIRGIHINKKKDFWWFSLPHLVGIDPETKEKVRYPVINFIDQEKQKVLLTNIRTHGKEYIQKEFIDKKVNFNNFHLKKKNVGPTTTRKPRPQEYRRNYPKT